MTSLVNGDNDIYLPSKVLDKWCLKQGRTLQMPRTSINSSRLILLTDWPQGQVSLSHSTGEDLKTRGNLTNFLAVPGDWNRAKAGT